MASVYVIQQRVNDKWEDVRDTDGQPLWYLTKSEVNREFVARKYHLDHEKRITRVKD
jgi:hypothetical protein